MFYAMLLGAMGGWMIAAGYDDLTHKRRREGAAMLAIGVLMGLAAVLVAVIEVLPVFMTTCAAGAQP